ncbi:sensor histidine kinase [Dechloromonas sp. ZY10]|uniref:sensor histidine kinase n=1 Tax=Dechloromonas aquae TaxID=2664436 RepID=UPI003529D1C6
MKSRFFSWLSIALLFFSASPSFAQTLLELDPARARIATQGHLVRLIGTSREPPLAALNDPTRWQALPGAVSAGYRNDDLWLRLRLHSPTATSHWRIAFSNALLDEVDLHLLRPDGHWEVQRSGENIGREHWPHATRAPLFDFSPDAGQVHELLIRLRSKNALNSEIVFWQADAYEREARSEELWHGLYFGACLLLIIFHAFFWRMTREAQSGCYLLYVIINAGIEVLTVGLPQQQFLMPAWLSDPLLGITIALSPIIGVRFALLQLELPARWPVFCRRLQLLYALLGGVAAITIAAGHYAAGVILGQILALGSIPFFTLLALWLLWQGHRPARFYLFAFGIFYLGVTIAFLRNLTILPTNLWTLNAAAVGTMIHLVLMSLRLNFRYDSLRSELAAAQQSAVTAMTAFNEQLEQEVKHRTSDLRQEIQRRQLLANGLRAALENEQRVREEQKEFAAMISHEFRTPLSIISTTAQQLVRNPEAPWEKTVARCNNLRTATARMLSLVDEYLAADRIDAESAGYQPRPCTGCEVLQAIADEWPDERLSFEQDAALPALICDPALLRVAVRNLISNALRHSPEHAPVHVTAKNTARGLEILVANRGLEIPPEEAERLFLKYFRGRQAQQRPGAGLGLYIARRIARLHGGEIELQNRGEAGEVIFALHLPSQGTLPARS